MRFDRCFARSYLVVSLLSLSVGSMIACGSHDDGSAKNPTIDDPRAPELVGTGTVDVIIADAPPGDATASSYGVSWWEIELQIDGDGIEGAAPSISTSDTTRVTVAFWGHDGAGVPQVEGRFSVDVSRWLGLSQEHDLTDVAMIFDGSSGQYSSGGGLDDDERTAVFGSVLNAITTGDTSSPGSSTSSFSSRPGLHTKGGGSGGALATCAGEAKKAVKDALSAIAKKFSTCVSCASEAIDDPTSDTTWKACGACESGILDASDMGGLFSFLECKKALEVPPADDDSAVKRPADTGLPETTCFSSSSDGVHGTYRMSDGKGGIACGDCPDGTVPVDSVMGCAPKSDDPSAPGGVDDSKAVVEIPGSAGDAPSTRVVSRDACILTEITQTGTVNFNPVLAGPTREIFKIGERSWDKLPSVQTSSQDTWNITSDTHSGPTNGVFAITGDADKSSKPTVAPTTGTVDQAIARGGCSTDAVLGLSEQILEELGRCVNPGELVKVPGNAKIDTSRTPLTYLEKPAADALLAAASKATIKIWVNQMFRTVVQQYFISKVGSNPKCGITAWARPGASNHETGLALDISNYAQEKSVLEAAGFKWFGSGDVVHFDYQGAGAVDLRGKDVLAFQRLWNRNHPEDPIAEDGSYGPATQTRLGKSPATGFATGTPDSCAKTTVETPGGGSREPMTFLTNVTTSDLFPGSGCESGNDASHTDVSACVTSKQVCAPYWCDLADMVLPSCGTTTKPPVDPPTSPPPSSAPSCDPLGSFKLTYYYIAVQSDYSGAADTAMYARDGSVLATMPLKFVKASRLEGTGKLSDGRALNWAGKCAYSEYGCFTVLDSKYSNGRGASGRGLSPYKSIAVDPSVVPLGTRVYIPELAGKTMPDGSVHDGWVQADDTGGAILGNHIDFFVQDRAAYLSLAKSLGLSSVTLIPEGC
jgi:3D (Asp-Asp-Asp) domain-containing protein